MQSDSTSLDLVRVLRVLRHRAPVILLCLVATAAAAYAVSKHQRKQYTASATIYFRGAQLDQEAAGLPVIQNINPQPQTDTNLKLATLPRIAVATAAAVGATPVSIKSSVSVSQQSDTDLATVAATSTSPSLAARIANTYSQQVIAYRQRADESYYSNALRSVRLQYRALTPTQEQSVQGANLLARANSLQSLSQLQNSDVQLAQSASVPSSPSSPKTTRNTALGAILGLLLGLGLALLLERFDRRLREPGDLAEVYGTPVIGVVPHSSALALASGTDGALNALPPAEAEIFGLLRAHIRYFNVDRELRVVLIVSAAAGDGKTTVARNLAIAAAQAGSRVLFVEGDLRRATAAQRFGVQRSPGISEVLIEAMPFEDAVQTIDVPQRAGKKANLDVLVAGSVLPPNPAQVIESHAMEALLDRAKAAYDLVVIDTPPLAVLPDAFPLLRRADGVLIVSRLGRNLRDVAARMRETLANANAPLIGVVANDYRQRRGSAYAYGYRYDYATAASYAADASSSSSAEDPSTMSNGATSDNGGTSALSAPVRWPRD